MLVELWNRFVSNFYLKGEDPDHKPTIYSGESQLSFEFQNADKIVFENLIMKNVETDGSFHGGDLFITGREADGDLVKFDNMDIYAADCFYIWSYYLEVTNSNFYITNGVGFSAKNDTSILKNLNIDAGGYVDMFTGGVLKATDININFDRLPGKDNVQAELNPKGTNYLENVNIKGGNRGIYMWGIIKENDNYYIGYKGTTYINNCDLSQNDISLYAQGNNAGNDYDIIISDSKINSIKSEGYKRYLDIPGPIVYVKASTKWTNKIERSTEDGVGNAIKLLDGRIIIEQGNTTTITVDDGKYDEIELGSFFDFDGFNDYQWISTDEEIVKLVDGKIIPGKEGTAYILGTYANSDDVYKLEVVVKHKVKEEEKEVINPNTGDKIGYLFIVVLVLCLAISIMFEIMNKKKVI